MTPDPLIGNQFAAKWLPEHDAALRSWFDRGYSFARAAVRINEQCGTAYSRNSCISRAGRIGLVSALTKTRQPMISKKSEGQRARVNAPKPRAIVVPLLRCDEIVPRHLTFGQLEREDCKYPYGDNDFTFCGLPQLAGCSYCPPHAVLCGKSPC